MSAQDTTNQEKRASCCKTVERIREYLTEKKEVVEELKQRVESRQFDVIISVCDELLDVIEQEGWC